MSQPQPITARPTEEVQIDQQYFTIGKGDHDTAVGLFIKILDYQKAHPEIYYYTRSRSYFRHAPDNPEHETFMFIDEFDNREVYWQSLMNAKHNDSASAANNAAWAALVVPPPPTGHLEWTELKELRIQYGFREPLWPGSADPRYGDPGASVYDPPHDAITAAPTPDTQIDTQEFKIRTADHDKALAAAIAVIDYERAHPERFYFTRTRSFFRPDPDNPEHEIWMFIDEFDSRDAYWQSLMNALHNDPDILALQKELVAYFIDGCPTGHQVWTEIKELRVQYSDREPLWPGSPA
jgi:hypothetical protein